MERTGKKTTQKRVSKHKSKARWCQNWVADRISKLLDIPVEQDGDIEPRRMGMHGPDVILRGDALKRFPASIECASGESISWLDKVRQARKAMSGKDAFKFWLFFYKRKEFQSPLVIMDAVKLFQFLGEIERLKTEIKLLHEDWERRQ